MAVKVTLPNADVVEHKKGSHATVKEGHLHVWDSEGMARSVVAVYAPGHWATVDVD